MGDDGVCLATHPTWRGIVRGLETAGLNAIGVADGQEHEAWLPGCRSVVVVGSGGPALWEGLLEELRHHPERFSGEPHPLDAHVRKAVEGVDPDPGRARRWVFADLRQDPPVSMQALALAAGLGWRSKLRLVLHPEHGPWLGLRAACFTTDELPVDGPRTDPDPCRACSAPCAGGCPGRALRSGALDWRWCAWHRGTTSDCLDRCDARLACPVGAGSAYPDLEQTWHHDHGRGRRRMAAELGVQDRAAPPRTDRAALARRVRARLGI